VTPAKPRTRPLVMLTWRDANATAAEVYRRDVHHAPTIVQTVGWMLDRDDAGVSIACEAIPDAEGAQYRGVTFVPAGMVVRVTRLRKGSR
jgi:hypothetical protein